MSKSKKPARTRDVPKLPTPATEPAAPKSHAFRETVESIVIAFVLAFLFRTFEAEAFVIPTGSMAPTLMGRHKDVDCPKCGYRYQVSASEEAPDRPDQPISPCLAGMCPMCHYVLPMVPKEQLPMGIAERQLPEIESQRSYNGDRILVNKYNYTLSDPERWDVVVFKYPYDAKINFIKRLVGLPGETLRIYQGDLFVKKPDAAATDDFDIERKPADKFLAMRQLVHDTNYDPVELDEAGWPLRWNAAGSDGWKVEKARDGTNVRQQYSIDTSNGGEGWLQYTHTPPDYETWRSIIDAQAAGKPIAKLASLPEARRRLITDANPYNARIHAARLPSSSVSLEIDPALQGVHWVGDLMVEADVNVESAKGELILELIEAGRSFRCTVNLANGEATLSASGAQDYAPKAKTPIGKPGSYRLGFANYDDHLQLWVNGSLIQFEGGTAYDASQVFGERRSIIPKTGDDDLGDLAPVRIGAKDAKLSVTDLQVWRDIYYIADKQAYQMRTSNFITDFPPPDWSNLDSLPYTPSLWSLFDDRRSVEFPLHADQFFVMGDNSAESSDARLWGGAKEEYGPVHGQHLERRLLIGKALSVYWPHSWNRVPGTPIPFPLFPNIEDMRLVR